MTAASAYPPGSDQGPSEGRGSEPSMEDILASIRRIIADDQQANGSRLGARRAQPTHAATPPATTVPQPSAPDHADTLDLAQFVSARDEVNHETHAHPIGETAHPPADDAAEAPHPEALFVAEAEDLPAPAHFDPSETYDAEDGQREVSLLASPMSESVMSAFEALAATVVLENKPMLEGILRDLLRPMLKTWLDDNLPRMVERLVRIEIERVARGPRG